MKFWVEIDKPPTCPWYNSFYYLKFNIKCKKGIWSYLLLAYNKTTATNKEDSFSIYLRLWFLPFIGFQTTFKIYKGILK